MKKMLAGLLVVLTLVCAMPLGVFAAEPEDETVKPCFSSACPICTTPEEYVPLNIIRTWTEYNYYYTTVWVTVRCDKCGYERNEVLTQVPNQTSRDEEEKRDDKTVEIE